MTKPSVRPVLIYRLKLALTGAVLVILALLASSLAEWLDGVNAPPIFIAVINGIAGLFLVSGAIGIAADFFTGRSHEEAMTENNRAVQLELMPDTVDTVLRSFAASPEDMKRVATPEFLDQLATSALTLRMGDERFASEVYAGLLAQAIRTPERWTDVDINIRLSSINGAGPARSTTRAPLFDAVVTWEYSVTPSTRVQRFASTNNLREFSEFADDIPGTSAWYISEATADARKPGAFEVLSYSVDGHELDVRCRTRTTGQTYSVDLGAARAAQPKEVRIRQVYRTVVRKAGHRFRIALTQPTHGLRLVLDYTDTDIAELKVGDMLSTAVPAQVKTLPADAPGKQVEVSVPGWLLPRAEVSFVWALSDEVDAGSTQPHSHAA